MFDEKKFLSKKFDQKIRKNIFKHESIYKPKCVELNSNTKHTSHYLQFALIIFSH
jgi:hypothetical protein